MRERMGAPPPHPWLLGDGPPVVCGCGSLHPRKGFDVLLRSFASLAGERELRLIIVGEGRERARLEALARDLDVAQDVALVGTVANPLAYMARAQLFVLSSTFEGLPTVLIEALACGTPVVSTDCPYGPREILDDGRYGRLVPIGDHVALAEAMRQDADRSVDARPRCESGQRRLPPRGPLTSTCAISSYPPGLAISAAPSPRVKRRAPGARPGSSPESVHEGAVLVR